jgi:nucleoside-diphosphate-sugar epimerase
MKKILITGGAGFVGRHFIKYFLDKGDEVWCVDNLVEYTGGLNPLLGWPLYNPIDYKNFKYVKSDCRDFFLTNFEYFDTVFHLAAMVGGREMIENNPLAVADDLSIDSMYWNWARKSKPGKTICFSSSAAYPIKYQKKDDFKMLTEDMIRFDADIGMPDMSYGWAKLTHEYLAKIAYERYGLKSVTYRPFSGYGEDQDLAYPFPSICKRIINHSGDRFIVWGTGEQMRDFIHISDCVNGVIKTMDNIENGDAINLSTGILTSFQSFARKALEIYGLTNVQVIGNSTKPEGVFARGGDTKKQNEYGFFAHVPFEEGIKKALNFFEQTL